MIAISGCDDEAVRVQIYFELERTGVTHYPMSLTPHDLTNLVYCLQNLDPTICGNFEDWARDFVTSIAATLDIEVI